ncbi:uncharacterized protein [Rutidosis leptorrhynchoides]|uniref:uncharacterized protein n=1 Tax=Rutidosis leptorrhynchoides TaxID=125765 RepID=UPI003A9A3276
MAKQEVLLLDFWASMFGMRVRIALAEKGISYEYSEQDLRNKSQLLLESNPVHKKIPVLIHNGKPICESRIIVEYIDEVWNDKAPLFPSDPYDKAAARFWADFIDKKLYMIGRNLYLTKGEEHEASRQEYIDCLKLLEGELGDKPYFGGQCFGYLDISLVPFCSWFEAYATYGKINFEQECPKLMNWFKRCVQNKESVSKTLPDGQKILEFVQLMRKKFGVDDLYLHTASVYTSTTIHNHLHKHKTVVNMSNNTTPVPKQVILLDYWTSIYGMRVRIALAEKCIPYDYQEQDLRNKSQLLLDSNPIHKQIPVLIHNGKPICESSIIVEYIDEVWNDKAPLFPSHPYDKARARFWANFIDKKLYQIGRNLCTLKGEEHEASRKEFMDCIKLFEKELGDKPYFGGESFGYLDVSLIPFYSWFQAYETYGKFDFDHECPKLIAWTKRCIQNKESVSNTLPDLQKVFDFVQYLRKKFGVED